jgi:HEAT repeat protein
MSESSYGAELIEQARSQRGAVVAKVRQFGGVKAAVPVLGHLARKAPYPDLRAAAAEALGEFHSGDTEEVLIAMLKSDRSWHVRNAAVKALARIATPGAIKALEEATRDRAYGVREDARALLEQLRGKKAKR